MNLFAFIGNLSGMDGIILLLIVLLLFGAKRLPELARGLGSAVNEFNKAKNDVQRQLSEAVEPPPAVPQVPPVAAAPQVPPQAAPQAPVQAQVPPAPQPPVSPSQPEQKA